MKAIRADSTGAGYAWRTIERAKKDIGIEARKLGLKDGWTWVFQQWLALHYPQRAARVMARIREMRGGSDYDSSFATRMQGSGLWAGLVHQRFTKACTRLGLNRERVELDLTQFRPGLVAGQGSLF